MGKIPIGTTKLKKREQGESQERKECGGQWPWCLCPPVARRTDEVVLHLVQHGGQVFGRQRLGAHQVPEHGEHAVASSARLGAAT